MPSRARRPDAARLNPEGPRQDEPGVAACFRRADPGRTDRHGRQCAARPAAGSVAVNLRERGETRELARQRRVALHPYAQQHSAGA